MFLGSWAWSLPRTSRRSLWAVVWSRGESLKRFSTSLCFEVSFIHNYSWTNRHFHRKRNFKCTLLLLKITVKNHKQHFQTLTIPNKDFPPHDIVYKYFPKNKAILASKRKYAMHLILAPLTIIYYCHLLATGGDAVWGRSRRGEGRGWVDRGTGQTQVLSQPFARHAWHQNKQSLLKFPDPFWTTCVDFFQVWWSLPNSWAEQREDYW